MPRVIGLDVSLSRTGVAVLDDGVLVGHAVIETDAAWPRHRRLGELEGEATVYLQRWSPDILAIETSAAWQKMSRDSRASVEALAQARAAVLIAAYHDAPRHACRIVEMDCNEVREAVTANWNASKRQVQENLIIRGYTLPTLANGKIDPDVADAVACGLAVWGTERLLAMKEVT